MSTSSCICDINKNTAKIECIPQVSAKKCQTINCAKEYSGREKHVKIWCWPTDQFIMKVEPYYWSILFLYLEYAHCDKKESGIRQRKLLLKVTENAFHISQDLLPVGPICLQHLLHSLWQVNIGKTPTALKLLPEYIWECLMCTVWIVSPV